ncbi:type II secretion system protein [Kinneretia aquatilis]|uniref:type II secretion system protein n=1 Tax=Kinneretia aquatilis TaxID=2070761 RepID=UPI001A9FBDAB|nr:type II secretion system protein [Paucibacter aquatile]
MRRLARLRASCGFTYLGLLFFVALTAAALAALGQAWSTAAQRERERELQFRGEEIARAIQSYLKVTGGNSPQYPRTIEDLLVDRRGVKPLHHLRRAYADPFTGKPDWVLVPEPSQPERFHAVHSRSERALLKESRPDGMPLDKASDWLFVGRPQGAAASSPDPAASEPPVDRNGLPLR